jgi:hypothetical protein
MLAAAFAAIPASAPAVALRSTPSLGMAEGRCRLHEPGPAVMITAIGLKDRDGILRAELYPPDDEGFLADDNVLLGSGRTFRRAEERLPANGPVRLCIRAPSAGDRDADRKFSLFHDGIGFPGNPSLGLAKPHAASARLHVGDGIAETRIVLNYRRGLFTFAPIGGRQ